MIHLPPIQPLHTPHNAELPFDRYQERNTVYINTTLTLEERFLETGWGLIAEAGEVVDTLKKILFHQHPLTYPAQTHLVEELGDLLYYISDLAALLQVPLSAVAVANDQKLRRRYPEGFTSEASVTRQDVEDRHVGSD